MSTFQRESTPQPLTAAPSETQSDSEPIQEDVCVTKPNNKRGRLDALIHFTMTEINEGVFEGAKCNHCEKSFAWNNNSDSSTMIKHITENRCKKYVCNPPFKSPRSDVFDQKKNSRFDITPCWWRPWSDLSQDILCLILQSKRLILPDRLRFRAVCKSWRIPKDEIIKSFSSSMPTEYPWLFCCLPTPCNNIDKTNHSLRFQLVGPHHCQSHEVSKSIEKSSYWSPIIYPLANTYASKFGWRLHGNVQGCVWSLFFHNPFSNDHIVLPPLLCPGNIGSCAATFTASPSSNDCEVLVLFGCGQQESLIIGRYTHNRNDDTDKSKSWTTQLLAHHIDISGVKVHYMDGKLYCLLCNYYLCIGALISYSLAHKTWEIVSSKTPFSRWRFLPWSIWLTQIGSSLAMVYGPKLIDHHHVHLQAHVQWKIYKFDEQRRRWIDMEKELRNIAFFVVKETIISLPLEDEDDCLIFHIDKEMDCYSVKQRRNIYPQLYPGLCRNSEFFNFGFIEPHFHL